MTHLPVTTSGISLGFRRPPHTFSWFTFVFSLWKVSLHWRHLKLRSWCNSPCILFPWRPRFSLLLQIFPHTYITLECLGVLHLSIPRHNSFLLRQITSTPLSQPKVFYAFLNDVMMSLHSLHLSMSCQIVPASDHFFSVSLRILLK